MRLPQYSLAFFTFLFLVFQNCGADVVRHTFILRYEQKSPNGVLKSQVLTINGEFPGPTIEANYGDWLEVDVVNLLQTKQPVSIHWHGIYQKGSPYEDGPSHIIQCPLKVGHVQRYRFSLNQTGTYWYHAHLDSQYTEGLWGALIVHKQPAELYPSHEELVITLSDWYHSTALENEEWFLSTASAGYPPHPVSGLMNGLGRYPCPFAEKVGLTCSPELQFRPVFHAKVNKTVRLRVINTSAHTTFNFTVEGHSLQTVEVDGVDTVPVEATSAYISVGQRYSFLLKTGENPGNRFLIRADVWKDFTAVGPEENYTNINPFPDAWMGDVTGVLELSSEAKPRQKPITKEIFPYLDLVPEHNHTNFLEESLLTPANPLDRAPSYYDLLTHLTLDFVADKLGIIRGFLKDGPFSPPMDKPLIMAVADGDEIKEEARVVQVGVGQVVQIIVDNYTNRSHPLHLHGYHFHVMGKGEPHSGNFNGEQLLRLDGVKRDTVWIHAHSWIVLRFTANNVGVWPLHCHIDWHMLSGMVVNFVVGQEQLQTLGVPYETRRLCEL